MIHYNHQPSNELKNYANKINKLTSKMHIINKEIDKLDILDIKSKSEHYETLAAKRDFLYKNVLQLQIEHLKSQNISLKWLVPHLMISSKEFELIIDERREENIERNLPDDAEPLFKRLKHKVSSLLPFL